MFEVYEKLTAAKENTAERKREKKLQDEWLKTHKPTICEPKECYIIPNNELRIYNDYVFKLLQRKSK